MGLRLEKVHRLTSCLSLVLCFSLQTYADTKSCSELFSEASVKSSKASQAVVNTTIRGVMATPQSAVGSTIHALSFFLRNNERLLEFYELEVKKRELSPRKNPELIKLMTVANAQHGKPRVSRATQLAPLTRPEDLPLDESELKFPADLNEKMLARFIEIYNFPIETLHSTFAEVVNVFAKELIVITGMLKT